MIFVVIAAVIILVIIYRRKKKKAQEEPGRYVSTVPPYEVLTVAQFKKLKPAAYVAFDLETTGLDPAFDRIIEIGAVYVENHLIVRRFSQLVNPRRFIPAEATDVNHITEKMVKKAPGIEKVLPAFLAFIGDAPVLVAHNAKFDADFITIAADRLGLRINAQFFDTLALARYCWPGLNNHKLGNVARHIMFTPENEHRAESDARAVQAIVETGMEKIRAEDEKKAKERKKKLDDARAAAKAADESP